LSVLGCRKGDPMQESEQKPQAQDALAPYPPILVVGTKMKYLRAYDTLDEAVKKINENFLAGGYYDLEDYGLFDRYRLVDEVGFFDAAGRELQPIWNPERGPTSEKDDGYRLSKLAVKNEEPYVRSRFRALLREIRPVIEENRKEGLEIPSVVDDSREALPEKNLSFEELCRQLTHVLSNTYGGGWLHRALGGH
jgi:hypothetical protein